jgi:hypothetical protein
MTDVFQKVREGHRFDLLERGFQSATERNRFLTSSLAKRQRPATEEEETYPE